MEMDLRILLIMLGAMILSQMTPKAAMQISTGLTFQSFVVKLDLEEKTLASLCT